MGFPYHSILFLDGMGVNLAYRMIENAVPPLLGEEILEVRFQPWLKEQEKSTPQDGLGNGHVDAEGAVRQPMGGTDNPIAFDEEEEEEEDRGMDTDHSSWPILS